MYARGVCIQSQIIRQVVNPQAGRHIEFGNKGAIKQKMDSATAWTYTVPAGLCA